MLTARGHKLLTEDKQASGANVLSSAMSAIRRIIERFADAESHTNIRINSLQPFAMPWLSLHLSSAWLDLELHLVKSLKGGTGCVACNACQMEADVLRRSTAGGFRTCEIKTHQNTAVRWLTLTATKRRICSPRCCRRALPPAALIEKPQ